jgi:hypothetical protein
VAPEVLVQIALGIALLCAGRRLFWLFVGAAGFFAGMQLAGPIFKPRDPAVVLAIALVAGVIGAVLALVLQKLAIGLAGFAVGAYVVGVLVRGAGMQQSWIWIASLAGGIVGAILVLAVFDWALIALSSLSGAVLLSEALRLRGGTGGLVVLALAVAGILIQSRLLRGPRSAPS